jgi:hypothetical protein
MASNVTIPEGFRVVSQTPSIPDGFKIVSQESKQPEKDYTLGRLANIDSGATFGFGRKLGGLVNALGSYPVDRVAELMGVENTPSFSDRYNEIVEPAVRAKEEYQKDKPVESFALEFGSGIANPLNKVGAGYIGKGATNTAKALRSIGVGGASGGASALGRTENLEDLGNNLKSDVTTGTVTGGVIPLVGATVRGVGNVAKHVLGKTTGAGDRAIADAFKAGQTGDSSFIEKMRGLIDAEGIEKKIQSAFYKIKTARNKTYKDDITRLKQATIGKKLDIQPVINDAKLIIKEVEGDTPYLIRGQKSKVIKEIREMISNFSKDAKNHNLSGFDKLKQSIQDIDVEPGSQAEMIKTRVANSVKGQILKQSPEYKTISDAYSKSSDMIDDLKKVFSLNRNANSETILKKIQSTARNNAHTDWSYRSQLLKQIDPTGEIQKEISANALNSWMPRGVIGGGVVGGSVVGGFVNPATLKALLLTSPKLAGYGAYGLGRLSKATPELEKLTPYITQLLNNE